MPRAGKSDVRAGPFWEVSAWRAGNLNLLMFSPEVRGDVKIRVLATARFCKSLQTLATTGLPTLSQVCQPLARSEKQTPFSRYPSNDILITLIGHQEGHVGVGALAFSTKVPIFQGYNFCNIWSIPQ